MKGLPAVLLLSLLSLKCPAQNAVNPIGEKAPEIDLRRLLQAPAGTPLSSAAFDQKAVVLEFWATWCGPCVAEIPHLNELAEQFKDKPVVFLSLTDENADVISAFLKKRPMAGWIGIDKAGETFKNFEIEARPQTVLIDAHGIVKAWVHPDQLNTAVIEHLALDQPIPNSMIPPRPAAPPIEKLQGAPPPLVEVFLRPAASVAVTGTSPGFQRRTQDGHFEYYGATLRWLLEYTEKVRRNQIVGPAWIDESRYDLSTVVPEGREDLRIPLTQQFLLATFQLKTRHEIRPTPVYALRIADNGAGKMKIPPAGQSPAVLAHPGHITAADMPVSWLKSILNIDLGGDEVIDETGLKGSYDFDLQWQQGDADSLQRSLKNQLGLIVTRETLDREWLVVVSATEPKTW